MRAPQRAGRAGRLPVTMSVRMRRFMAPAASAVEAGPGLVSANHSARSPPRWVSEPSDGLPLDGRIPFKGVKGKMQRRIRLAVLLGTLLHFTSSTICVPHPFEVVHVIDGDTVTFWPVPALPTGRHRNIVPMSPNPAPLDRKPLSMRIRGVDAPAQHGACWCAAWFRTWPSCQVPGGSQKSGGGGGLLRDIRALQQSPPHL